MKRIGDAWRGWLHGMVGHRRQSSFLESRFDELATYNSEVARGLQHTHEKQKRMEELQADYNAKMMANDPSSPTAAGGQGGAERKR